MSAFGRYELLKEHRINGKLYAVGTRLTLVAQLGDGLCEQAIAKRLDATPAVKGAQQATVTRTPSRPAPVRRCCGW